MIILIGAQSFESVPPGLNLPTLLSHHSFQPRNDLRQIICLSPSCRQLLQWHVCTKATYHHLQLTGMVSQNVRKWTMKSGVLCLGVLESCRANTVSHASFQLSLIWTVSYSLSRPSCLWAKLSLACKGCVRASICGLRAGRPQCRSLPTRPEAQCAASHCLAALPGS